MTWDASVVVVQQPDGRLLGVTRGGDMTNINFPGGYRENRDVSPADTARRELWEETGIEAGELKPLAKWRAGEKIIIAFQALDYEGELKPSSEGKPVWILPSDLIRTNCLFKRSNVILLRKIQPITYLRRNGR